jgi:excisionase family DNA binding protein
MEEERKDLEVLWTVQQVAKYLTVSTKTVYGWIRTGKIIDQNKIVRFTNRVRIPRSEVERIARGTKTKLENNNLKS